MFAGGADLPWELLINVVSYLNFEDFVNFKATRRRLLRALRTEGLCREIVKVAACNPPSKIRNLHCLPNVTQRCIPYAKEAGLADRKMISYMTAVDRTFDRREAFALACPYSALVVGCGSSFLYRDGFLCYISQKMIRVLNVHEAARVENLIDLEAMGRWLWPQVKIFSHVELLHYQEGILSFLYYSAKSAGGAGGSGRGERWLIVIDIRPDDPIVRLTIIIQRPRIWVRSNDRYLYVGSHDGDGDHGHREWVLQGYDLHTSKPMPPLPLTSFWGTDFRETIAFEIYDGYLYAVSNRSSYEVEEIDRTSFYHCQRFPVDKPNCLQRQRIWRRQHQEGPINDSWTDLGLHRDERTGEVLIIEARKEWKDGVGPQKRTFYTERLDYSGCSLEDQMMSETRSRSGSPPDHVESPPPTPGRAGSPYLPDEPRVKLMQKDPLYADPCLRIHRDYYPEYSGPEPAPDTFLLSRTRYRTFLPASSAFLDVVLDDYPLRTPGALYPPRTAQQQIRLRIGSRVRASPLDPTTCLLRPPMFDRADEPLPESEERFVDRGIQLWPPANAPTELVELLNPGGARVGEVSAVEDERSLVYRAAPTTSAEGAERNIVLVNFDRGVRHEWLPLLQWTGMYEPTSADVPAVTLPGKRSERREPGEMVRPGEPIRVDSVGSGSAGRGSGPNPSSTETRAMRDAERRTWWRREPAMHLEIQKGYRFK